MQLRATAQPTRATAQLALIHAWIDTNLILESSLWLRSEMRWPLSTRLLSQHLTPSARYVFQPFIQGYRDNRSLHQLSILQLSFRHPPTHSLIPICYRVCSLPDCRSVKTHDRQHSIMSGAFGRQNHPSSHSMTNHNILYPNSH